MGAPGHSLKIAEAGIDRYFERYYRKGRGAVRCASSSAKPTCSTPSTPGAARLAFRRSRPIRGWADVEDQSGQRPIETFAGVRIEGALARLTVLRGSDKAGPAIGPALDAAVRSLDAIRADAVRARGDAREALPAQIAGTEATLVAAAAAAISDAQRAAFEKEADAELAPFRERMTAESYAQSRRVAVERLVRHHFGLPEIVV